MKIDDDCTQHHEELLRYNKSDCQSNQKTHETDSQICMGLIERDLINVDITNTQPVNVKSSAYIVSHDNKSLDFIINNNETFSTCPNIETSNNVPFSNIDPFLDNEEDISPIIINSDDDWNDM